MSPRSPDTLYLPMSPRSPDTLYLVSDVDRIQAARIAAERLQESMQLAEGLRTVRRLPRGRSRPAVWVWDHFLDSVGGITSEQRKARVSRNPRAQGSSRVQARTRARA